MRILSRGTIRPGFIALALLTMSGAYGQATGVVRRAGLPTKTLYSNDRTKRVSVSEIGDATGSRRYVLEQDVSNIPSVVTYDEIISNGDVPAIFRANSGPELRAMIVSKPLINAIVHPANGIDAPGGSPEYYVLMNVLWQEHILIGLASSSDLIATKLGVKDVDLPFDGYGRHIPADPEPSDALLAATGLQYDHTPGGGWTERVLSSKREEPEPFEPGDWMHSAARTTPVYEDVDRILDEMLSGR